MSHSTDKIERTIDLGASIERVWHAISDPVEFGTWFGVGVETPFVVGEAARGRITSVGYEHVMWEAVVVAVEAPRLFAFTWHPFAIDPAVDYSTEPSTRVEFRLEAIGTGTRLTITETGFDALPEARRADALRMNGSGWSEQVRNIEQHVDG